MQKPKHSLSLGMAKCKWPIHATGRASSSHLIMSSCTPHAQISANALSGAHKDSPQRSAGSFNIVHPVRKALISSAETDRSTSDVEVANGENDMILFGTSVDTSSSLPCFFGAYSWVDQPFLLTVSTSDRNICSQSSNMLEYILMSRDFGIPVDDSMSTASSSSPISYLTSHAPPKLGLQHQAAHKSFSMFDDTSALLLGPPPPLESFPHQCGGGISPCSAASKLFYDGINIEGKATTLSNMSLVQGKKRSFSAIEPSSTEVSCNRAIKPHQMQRRRRHGVATTQPQSVAARTRREKLSKKIRMLQSLVPNGERLDTLSMLRQTLEYIKCLHYQLGELYHGPDSKISPLTSSKCEKWKAFIEIHSTTTTSTTSSVSSS